MDVDILLVPFELRPDMPEEGIRLSELQVSGHDSQRIEDHLLRIAEKDGFPMVLPDFLPKTHRAMILGEMARDRGTDAHWAMHHALFGAYFAEARDLNDTEVLMDIAKRQGLDADEVWSAWGTGAYDERLHQFRHVGMHLGITATPAALICNELLIGSRPYQVIKDAVDRCLVTPENAASEAGA